MPAVACPFFESLRRSASRLVHSCAWLLLLSAIVPAEAATPPGQMIGLPFTRTYSLDEIGEVARGARLGFDSIGRLAVVSDRSYVVLNDSSWLNLGYKGEDIGLARVVQAGGRFYYGALADWGEVVYTPDGRLRPVSFRPKEFPAWVMSMDITHIVPVASGVVFGGLNGLVHWNPASDEQTFIRVPGVAAVFVCNSQVYVSSHTEKVQRIDLSSRTLHPLDPQWDGLVVDRATALGSGGSLVSTTGRRLLVFDGENFRNWPGPLGPWAPGRVSDLETLVDGGVAIAVDGKGLYFCSETGECRLALTTPDYHRINDMITREPGVLWIAAEDVVQKVLYGTPVSIVDQRSGVSVEWPQVARWNDTIVIASNGDLSVRTRQSDGISYRFEPMSDQPPEGVWAVAASGPHLLIGNPRGVFARHGAVFEQVLSGMDVNRLHLIGPDLCYVIGAAAITAIRWDGSRWVECAARVPGVGFPAITHQTHASVWIELGANRAARVWLEDGALRTRIFDEFPWTEPCWISIGVVGDIVVLGGPDQQRLFFDESVGELCAAPELQALLVSAPHPVSRVREDQAGVIWAAHARGVLTIHPEGSGHRFNSTALRIIHDRYPVIQFDEDRQIWISTGTALYHVDPEFARIPEPSLQPRLISIADGRTGLELFSRAHAPELIDRFPYARNSLSLRFFAGGYSALRTPGYEFTLHSRDQDWTIRSPDSLLALPNLEEGVYRVSAQLLDSGEPVGTPGTAEFTVDPPWYRAPWAYVLYWAAGVLAACGAVAGAVRHTRRKHAFLENLVRERTEELRSTMARLQEETRHAATLAERNRLAGEIHDSLQQGLSGLMLQIAATLRLPDVPADVRSRLTVARNMVSFTRQEVQQAVWNLESPLLEHADLAEALQKMAALISSGAPRVEVQITGEPAALSSSTKHHLLRIAQEAITNAVRHGEADTIVVHLQYDESSVALEVSDDGRGFVPEKVFADGIGHFGLRGLRGRAAKINGELQIISAIGRGTRVRIVLPSSHAIHDPDHGAVSAAS